MQERDLSGGGFEQQESVIFDRHFPEVTGRAAGDAREVAQEPARQVDQVYALVQQFAAARGARIGSPLALVAGTAAVSVAAADEQQRTGRAGIEDRARISKGAVIPVTESDAHQRARADRKSTRLNSSHLGI